ncbi:MAG: hydrogenase formation protein HypD [Pseudomonadales bacterium]|nr:hydrogenase formation protein HypD [Pseudomonadales bacterium]
MKYIKEFRNQHVVKHLASAIHAEALPHRVYPLMEFCGGHTHGLFRYGLQELVPKNVEFIHGPGCPVCVLPGGRIDSAIELVQNHDVILCTYADLMRVPASKQNSLMKLKAAGGDVRMVYSVQDSLAIARQNPERQVVFFAIGFETTTPPTAVALQQARDLNLNNYSIYCNHVLTPAAMTAILSSGTQVQGILGPSHVSTIIGSQPYHDIATRYNLPIVISGFEPADILQSTLMLIRQINRQQALVENQYTRAVTEQGNQKAKQLIQHTLTLRPTFEWRGLGQIPHSGLAIQTPYQSFDAEIRFSMNQKISHDIKSCQCPAVLRGQLKPTECALFGNPCTPENPMGACMVSSEGACAAYWSYRRHEAA